MQQSPSIVKIDWSFIRLAVGSYVGMALLAAYPFSEFATAPVTRSVAAGSAMSLANLLVGYGVIEFSYTKLHTAFLKWVLGGMVVRLFLMWGALLALLQLDFHSAALMMSLLFLYVMNLVLEIYYLQKKVDTKSRAISS
ncbi:MAG: hypothetical protein HY966_07580 [Ignavibacteriales bacterium]|nr:hypothetical protein [Ignavibacteriales bacterium]